jgi:hypothetical protein
MDQVSARTTHPVSAPPDTSRFAALLTAIFCAAALAGAARHEIWRDEAQAWLLARDSATPWALLANMRYEGHPALWHLILWLLARITHQVFAMQALHAGLATAGVYVMARHAPLGRLQKLLFAAGYFTLFEYGLIARAYVLGVALLWTYCALHPRRRERLFALSIVLALLANTSVYGLLLALALSALLFPERTGARRRWPLLVFAVGCALAIAQMHPASDAMHAGWNHDPGAAQVSNVLRGVWRSCVPLPSLAAPRFWDTNLLQDIASGDVMLASALLVLGLGALALLPRPRAFLFYAMGTTALLAFSLFKFAGGLRHQGHLCLVLLAGLWLFAGEPDSPSWSARVRRWRRWSDAIRSPLLWGLLSAQAIAGCYAYVSDWRRPFSQTKAAAAFLSSGDLSRLPLYVDGGWLGPPLSAHLDRPVFHLDDGHWGSFAIWRPTTTARRYRPAGLLTCLQDQLVKSPDGPALLLINRPPDALPPGLTLTEIARFTGGIVGEEDCYIYRARLTDAGK